MDFIAQCRVSKSLSGIPSALSQQNFSFCVLLAYVGGQPRLKRRLLSPDQDLQTESDFMPPSACPKPTEEDIAAFEQIASSSHKKNLLLGSIHYACFHDAEQSEQGDMIKLPKLEDIVEIFNFIDQRPGQAMLIHCRAGQSRSTAVALGLIVRGLVQSGATDVAGPAVDYLLEIRRQSCPNALVLRQGLSLFLDPARTEYLVKEMLNHPQLMDNRFVTRLQKET